MSKAAEKLQGLRDSDELIVYITGDRQPPELFSTAIATDVLPIFDRHLSSKGKRKKISLFLYTNGGSIEAPWPIVSLIREYCSEFEVIVPSRASSAGTLICLGADTIVMTPSSFLSPVDPKGSFNVGQEKRSIQVEDVVGFIDFAKHKVGINEQDALAEVMKVLSSEVPPSILGSVNRTHSLIRMLAEKMLATHKAKLEPHQVKSIVENLTEKLYSHNHLIGRREAKATIGLKKVIHYSTEDEEKEIRDLLSNYINEMQLQTPFDPEEILSGEQEKEIRLKRAIISSSFGETAFTSLYKLIKTNDPNAPKPFAVLTRDLGWIEVTSNNSKSDNIIIGRETKPKVSK